MDTKTKALIIVFIIFSIQSITVTYWRYMVKQDYEVFYDESLFPVATTTEELPVPAVDPQNLIEPQIP